MCDCGFVYVCYQQSPVSGPYVILACCACWYSKVLLCGATAVNVSGSVIALFVISKYFVLYFIH